MPIKVKGRIDLSLVGKASYIIFKWNPRLHPRGPDGRFIETPDRWKMPVHRLRRNDVFVTPDGDAWRVMRESPDPLTPPVVQGLNPDSGEIEPEEIWDKEMDPDEIVAVVDRIRPKVGLADLPDRSVLEDDPNLLEPDWLAFAKQRIQLVLATTVPELDYADARERINEEFRKRGWVPGSGAYPTSDELVSLTREIAIGDYGYEPTVNLTYIFGEELPGRFGAEYRKWLKDANKYLSGLRDEADLEDLMRLRVAIAMSTGGDSWFKQMLVSSSAGWRAFEFMQASAADATPDDMAQTWLKDVAPRMTHGIAWPSELDAEARQVRRVAEEVQREYELLMEGMPGEWRQRARKEAVEEFFTLGLRTEFDGTELDMERLSSPDPEVRRGWLEAMLNDRFEEKYGADEAPHKIIAADRKLTALIERSERRHEEKWFRLQLGRGTYDPDAEHSVDGLTSRDLYDKLQAVVESTKHDKKEKLDLLKQLDPRKDARHEGREGHARALLHDMAVAHVRGETFEHYGGLFNIPRWENIDLQEQRIEDVEELLQEAAKDGRVADAPLFFTGGRVKDGTVQIGLSIDTKEPYAYAEVPHHFDDVVVQALEERGFDLKENPVNLNRIFTYEGTAKIYPGDVLMRENLVEGRSARITPKHPEFEDRFQDELKERIARQFRRDSDEGPDDWMKDPDRRERWEIWLNSRHWSYRSWMADIGASAAEGVSLRDRERTMADARERLVTSTMTDGLLSEEDQEELLRMVQEGVEVPFRQRIEYVPHFQRGDDEPDENDLTTGAPTSQRGQLRFTNYTPQEAIDFMREAKIVEDFEDEVPFTSIMRSERRLGRPNPLLPEYVRGDAHIPGIPAKVTHGITGGIQDLTTILDTSASLYSTSERVRLGIQRRTISKTSPKGDIRSGVDHVVFARMGNTIWGGGIKIMFKDDVLLRRDVVLAREDYGAEASRYDKYLSWKTNMRERAGYITPTGFYEPWEPSARDQHLDIMTNTMPDTNEWNAAHSVSVEDWAAVMVAEPSQAEEVYRRLQALEERGLITERPAIVVSRERFDRMVDLHEPVEDVGFGSFGLNRNAVRTKILNTVADIWPQHAEDSEIGDITDTKFVVQLGKTGKGLFVYHYPGADWEWEVTFEGKDFRSDSLEVLLKDIKSLYPSLG